MVTSIVLTGMYKIGISTTNKIKTPDGVTIEVKDIPFVRYRFDNYGVTELKFIQENKKKFPCVHVVEVTLNEDTCGVINAIHAMDEDIAVMLYVDIHDKEVQSGLDGHTLDLLGEASMCDFDRLNIRDKSTTLYPLVLTKLKDEISKATGIKQSEIGVCGGPCSFIDGNACITAVKARELLAAYSDRDDVVVPSSNHEGKIENMDNMEVCTNHCGCIRYHIFNHDVEAPATRGSGKKSTVKVSGTDGEVEVEKKEKKAKPKKHKGYIQIKW